MVRCGVREGGNGAQSGPAVSQDLGGELPCPALMLLWARERRVPPLRRWGRPALRVQALLQRFHQIDDVRGFRRRRGYGGLLALLLLPDELAQGLFVAVAE